MIRATLAVLLSVAAPVAAAPDGFGAADIVFLGEQHDNPRHHARQAELVAELEPAALVFEMLDAEQAAQVTPELIPDRAALEAALVWAESGWPDFEMYHPIFREAPDAAYYGAAVPRDEARGAMERGLAESFGSGAAAYGLTEPLPGDQRTAREALQAAAHCDALPAEMLPTMVGIQRLRDARIAQTALQALSETGGPVAVITGNGHARRDWGAPAYIARVAPEVDIAALGQGETSYGAPDGDFDAVEIGPDVDRDDPCAAFREG
ncbi:ChaN family lipoprotein [Roseivivax sediminis]|uniref:Haem-binding uptake, Tiki superfamily, ChaN n=1 Tax=Roseivivax sediminis TaxID=936889 RepID=A0A1I1W1R7_9RHOB|nr:ChaN family lipoprotein [Roseivivax sediminis]SFD89061.1 Haem-binding uptake, Tiki superfamily, ChaN [Roseivivax sediminis]